MVNFRICERWWWWGEKAKPNLPYTNIKIISNIPSITTATIYLISSLLSQLLFYLKKYFFDYVQSYSSSSSLESSCLHLWYQTKNVFKHIVRRRWRNKWNIKSGINLLKIDLTITTNSWSWSWRWRDGKKIDQSNWFEYISFQWVITASRSRLSSLFTQLFRSYNRSKEMSVLQSFKVSWTRALSKIIASKWMHFEWF